MPTEIRKITRDDIPGFHQALTAVAGEGKYLLTTPPVSLKGVESFILDSIERNLPQYVAVADGKVLGWADIIPSSRNTMSHTGCLGMALLPDYRGQGLGTELLKRVIAQAWDFGLKRLELEVFSDNEVAIHMYRKHGFEIEGVKKFARLHDNTYQDIVIMAQYRI